MISGAYVQLTSTRYRENFGLNFEEFQPGQRFKHRPGVTVSQQDNKDEALGTINNAQLHYDAHYAAKTEWKKCLGVSTMTLQYVIGMSWKTFGKKQRIICFDEIAMTNPVFEGDTLYAESEIVSKKEYLEDPDVGLLQVITHGINNQGNIVCKIQYQILVYKKGKHPADQNLPLQAFQLVDEKFSLYRCISDNNYIEQVGFYFEDLCMNETYEHQPAKTISLEESRFHSLRSLNWNPQYADAHYAEQYLNNNILINETFLISVITALTTRTFGRVVANLQWKNIQLPNLVHAEDTIRAESTVISKRESASRPEQGIVGVTTQSFNQKNQLVCSYERHLLVYKKGLGPYEAAGY